MKSTTVAEFQDMIIDPPTDSIGPEPCTDPFVGMRIEVDPLDAWGFVQGQIRAWLDERGIIAQEDEIRAKTNELWGAAQSTAPAASPLNGATVSSGGKSADLDSPEGHAIVEGVVRSAMGLPAAELPGMPEKPTPKMVMRVPSDAEFGQDGEEFFISSPLRARADVLIDRHPDLFEYLSGMSLTYLWKKAGGKSKGAPILGKAQKPAGLLKLFSESTFVIWLAADHCRDRYYGDPEIEQLLFHEMLHTAVGEADEETGRGGGPVLVPHQLEIFDAEIEVYGLEGIALKEAAPLFRQAVYDAPAPSGSVSSPSSESPKTEESPSGEDGPLVCSVCGNAVDEEEMSLEEVSEARQNPAVVLCEACGEDGIQDDDAPAEPPIDRWTT